MPAVGWGRTEQALLVLALLMGSFARVWEFGLLPPGLNPDEASAGVEALNLLRYGTDRNGVRLPVKLISWGSGQDMLYTSVLIPFVYVFGLTPTVVRIPMLAAALASLPLVFLVASRIFGRRVGLVATFMLAISPWHILLSRWGLDANILPFVFLSGFACLMHIDRSEWWFVIGCLILGLCLYAYGTAYAMVPVFLAVSLVILLKAGLLTAPFAACGSLAFSTMSTPMFLLLLVNGFGWNSVSIGPFTAARFPAPARWVTTTVLGSSRPLATLMANSQASLNLLGRESDGILYNVVEPFGIFYRLGLGLAVVGLLVLVMKKGVRANVPAKLLLAWVGTAFLPGLLQSPNINRINILLLGILILGAPGLEWIRSRNVLLGVAVVVLLGGCFAAFSFVYHGARYRQQASLKFQGGLLPALRFARAQATQNLCVTDKINMPYIYALFDDPISPAAFLDSVVYADESDPFRQVTSYDGYTFGAKRCAGVADPTYVLRADEIPPRLGNRYKQEFFDNFVVYYPNP